jgi:tetratricopeptide (TPR) repeat protein
MQALGSAHHQIDQGDFKGAELTLRQFVGNDPRSADAAYLLALVFLRLNEPKESLAEYTRAAALRTPTAEDLKHVADDYVLLNDYDDADKWMLRAVQMNDKDPEAWYALGRIRYTEQRNADAVACFQRSLKLAPHSVKAGDNLGLAYEGLNRTADAIRSFREALVWQKDSPHPSEQPMLNLATTLVELGQIDEAITLLTQAVAIAPQEPKIREQLGQAYLQKGQLPEAQRELEIAVKLSPDSAAYHFLLGRAYKRRGLDAESKAEFARASALNGTHSSPDTH